ncbi:MAG: hypothetical protein MK132_23465 [Lentisphaerales bacterium]|nr:hypothetical protein [Lentisphaerales bacterium]
MKTYGKSYVEKSDFQKFTKPITPENEKDILNWLRFATGKKCQIEGKDLRLNYGFQTKTVVSEAKEGVYQFLAHSKDNRVYFIYFEMSGAEARDSERAMKEFMRYMKIEPPKEAKASKFQSSKFKPSGKVSPEYLNTIAEVKKQVLNSKGWWLAQTNNYVLKSNMPTKKRSFARKVQEHVEFIRTVYEKFIPPIDEINAVSIITIPNTKEEYFSYTGAPDWSAGVWMSSRKELAVSPYTTDEDRLMNVLRHEAFHQYIFYALNENRSPAWFNEGHADLFSAIKKSGSRVTLIEDNYHLRKLLPLFQRGRISIEKHINLGHSAFYADKDLNYPLAWSIIYYLRKAVPILKNKKEYTQILPRALEAIAANKNIQAVTKEAFKGIDMKLFQKDFLEFWASKSLRSRASRNYIVPRK